MINLFLSLLILSISVHAISYSTDRTEGIELDQISKAEVVAALQSLFSTSVRQSDLALLPDSVFRLVDPQISYDGGHTWENFSSTSNLDGICVLYGADKHVAAEIDTLFNPVPLWNKSVVIDPEGLFMGRIDMKKVNSINCRL
ncbi:MAG: hypothetical protein AB8E15_07930 [Bdellovibrionales bacterium]